MSDPWKFACVFPGQGSQSMRMLHDLAAAYPVVRDTFQEASDSLSLNLWSLVDDGPEADLNLTENTQPVMLAAGVAVWRAWRVAGGAIPAVVAGHSLGEYSALVCAGALEFSDGVRLVRERARLMQAAVPQGQGAMAAILGLDDAEVIDLCSQAAQDGIVAAVNFNSPGQVVIAGEAAALARAMTLAAEIGAKRVLRLPVSIPAHCELMIPAARRFAAHLANTRIQPTAIPVLHNTDVASHDDADRIRTTLARQLYNPVRWVETIRAFVTLGVEDVLELGPGRVLTGLTKRIDRSLGAFCVHNPSSLDQALAKCEKR